MAHSLFKIRTQTASPLLLRWSLLSMALLDELVSGFLALGLPLVSTQLGLDYAQIGLLFTVGLFSSMLLEPIINLLSDRTSKRVLILIGLLITAIGYVFIGTTNSLPILLLIFILIFPAEGAAVGLSQAALIDMAPGQSMRTMTRWTLFSSIGDLLAPLLVPAILLLSFGWSVLGWLAAALWLSVALFIWPHRFSSSTTTEEEDEETPSLLTNLKTALTDPAMLRWCLLTVIPTMVDEVFLTYVIFFLRDALHAPAGLIGILITINMAAGMVGLLLLERLPILQRIAPERLLAGLALVTLLGFVLLLVFQHIVVAAISLVIISISAVCWYPIAKGQAYARYPGRSGMVRAIIDLTAPFDVALPLLVGYVSERFGIITGITLLGTAPLLILLLLMVRIRQ